MKKKDCTEFLFSTSSFLTGIGSIYNIAGNYYSFNHSKTGIEADHKAIFSDWQMTSNDLRKAIESTRISNKSVSELVNE